jgi:hypothetical protein
MDPSDRHLLLGDVVDRVVDGATEAAVDAIWAGVPAYAANPDPGLHAEVRAHCRAVFVSLATTLREQRPARLEDFPMTVRAAMRRVEQGIVLADFIRAFQLGQGAMWAQLRAAAEQDPALRPVILDVVGPLMQVVEAGSVAAATTHLEAEQFRLADRDRLRRDLVEDLIAGRVPLTVPRIGLLRTVGLSDGAEFVVASGALDSGEDDAGLLRTLADAVHGVTAGGSPGIQAVRQSELIAILPVAAVGSGGIESGLRESVGRLRATGIAASFGVSTTYRAWSEVPAGYSEARTARQACAGGAVLALTSLSPADYLVLRNDSTARRLINPAVRRYLEEDLAEGGEYIRTVLAVAADGLNVRATAERLNLHANTVYNRLDRIADRTGYDARRYPDITYLVTAIQLLTQQPGVNHT